VATSVQHQKVHLINARMHTFVQVHQNGIHSSLNKSS